MDDDDKCQRCGAGGAEPLQFSHELPPGRYGFGDADEAERRARAPVHVMCRACALRAVVDHVASERGSEPIRCARCEMDHPRSGMTTVTRGDEAALVCLPCAASGKMPNEARGTA